jgi:hypothetical protein
MEHNMHVTENLRFGSEYHNSCNTDVAEISGSHGGKYEDDCFLGYCAV